MSGHGAAGERPDSNGMSMELGLMVEPQMGGTYQQLLDLAQWAEAAGLDSFARSDHYLNMTHPEHATDALTSFGGLARETTTINLTVLVTPLTFRHPGVIAKTAGTLHEMSGGRFELGVGTGWMEAEHEAFAIDLPPLGERFDRFEDALGYLWAAFGRTSGPHGGPHFRLADIEVLPRVGEHTPIIIGGSGMKRTPTLAGRFADEYNMFATDRATLDERLAVMRRSAVAAGRDPDAIKISMAVSPMSGRDKADYAERLAASAGSRGMRPDEYARMLTDRGVPHGTVDHVAEAITAWTTWGVDRVYLQQFEPLATIDVDRVGEIVQALHAV